MKRQTSSVVKIVPAQGEEPMAAEIIEQSIVEIADAMRRIERTRLTRDAIVTLIHAKSKVPKRDIEIVLNNLEGLERTWLKKRQS
ncbi:MAG TPA: hypothetical protein VF507_08820 [Pyrinomonadaceae bacterium]|jgi:hypothetical protein